MILFFAVKVEQERNAIQAEKTELNTELNALKEEHLSLEQLKLELESAKLSVEEQMNVLALDKEKVCSMTPLLALFFWIIGCTSTEESFIVPHPLL